MQAHSRKNSLILSITQFSINKSLLYVKEKPYLRSKCYPCYPPKSCRSNIKMSADPKFLQKSSRGEEGGGRICWKEFLNGHKTTRGAMRKKTSHTDQCQSSLNCCWIHNIAGHMFLITAWNLAKPVNFYVQAVIIVLIKGIGVGPGGRAHSEWASFWHFKIEMLLLLLHY